MRRVALFVMLLGWGPLYASTAITVTDLTNNRVYQRDIGGTTGDIVLSGTYTGDAPSSIEGQVVFQSTPLREGRHPADVQKAIEALFQSTPLREGRRAMIGIILLLATFQSTPLREGRRRGKE